LILLLTGVAFRRIVCLMKNATQQTTVGQVVNFRGLGIPARVVSVNVDGRYIALGMRRLHDDGTEVGYTQYDYITKN
jgi:uncharacterized membrane protein YhaH (DUF805 family)